MQFKDPYAVAVIVSTLRRVHGDNIARALLTQGMSLAALIDATFSLRISNSEAVRMIAAALELGDFIFTPDIGPIWHVRYVYENQRASMRVVDMEMSTPHGIFASTEISLRLTV
ncbi:hypothetical protein [Bradyrhizobium sp. BR 1432]|uniref:hypothetical protein n=1 Tax=Bradyrhizobium sp. BR 1432 TaxID=3447966 RepID=UPI003EE68A7F